MAGAILVLGALFGALCCVSGWVMVRASRARWSGALFIAGGALILGGAAFDVLGISGELPALVAGYAVLPAGFLLFPAVRWRDPVTIVLATAITVASTAAVLWPEARLGAGTFGLALLIVHAWRVFERGVPMDRRAMGWAVLAWGGAGLVICLIGFLSEALELSNDPRVGVVALACLLPCPPATAIGAVRPDIVDVRGLTTSAVVTTTTFLVVMGVGIATVSVIEEAADRPAGVPATVILCLLLGFALHPLRLLLRGVVDRLLFGERPDPLYAATELADHLGDDEAAALHAVREALLLPYAAVHIDDDVVATSGSTVPHTRAFPLHLGGGSVGALVIGLRAGDLALAHGDEAVLRIVAPLLAQTLRAQTLARELARSRAAAIVGIEDERRRLRRDLHDGLGPTLTGIAFTADAARNRLPDSPATTDVLLAQLREDTTAVIAEVRRLIEGLCPPALDELGLIDALRSWAERLHTADGARLEVEFEWPPQLDHIGAAQEVAAYRIIVEALTNAARHSGSARAHVRVGVVEGALVIEVDDDGCGGAWTPGFGMSSMLERAEQLGGSVRFDFSPFGGRVGATLPLQP